MHDVTFVILGASGDLTKKKLLPALYRLVERGEINKFALIGAARSKHTLRALCTRSKKFVKKSKQSVWDEIIRRGKYVQVDFDDNKSFEALHDCIHELEKKFRLPGKRIFYLATLPSHFGLLTEQLAHLSLCGKRGESWPRLVYEKPFGNDLKSAKTINKTIHKHFSEKQIYRIDHYLGKELVANLSIMRFTNRFLSPLWNREHIEQVQVQVSEEIGIEERGAFYDKYGALRDFAQNHLLQLAALVAMDEPKMLNGDAIRDEKVRMFSRMRITSSLLGQYRGYKAEKGVTRNSQRDTFACVRLEVNSRRWKGVPFFLKVGKALDKSEARIDIKFRKIPCLLEGNCPADTNYLSIIIQPDSRVFFEFNGKVPGENFAITPLEMLYSQEMSFGPNTPAAYENLLLDVAEADHTAFVRSDGIEACWKIIDKVRSTQVHHYRRGSNGPKELSSWSKHHGVVWR